MGYFLVYCAVKRNQPMINHEIVLPGFLSGIMWAVAQTCWFVANGTLSMQVGFPLGTSGPGFVAAVWGVFVLGEIKGRATTWSWSSPAASPSQATHASPSPPARQYAQPCPP